MERRNAIRNILLLGGGAVAAVSGHELFVLFKPPDLAYLDKHSSLIAALADVIIPPTDSPGAKAAGVHQFIIQIIKEGTDRKAQNNFINGLKQVEAYTQSNYKQPFVALTAVQQEEVVRHFQQKAHEFKGIAGKAKNKVLGKSFYSILRQNTVIGYCTSQQGATQCLSYDYIPGSYIGCIPLAPSQKSWATK